MNTYVKNYQSVKTIRYQYSKNYSQKNDVFRKTISILLAEDFHHNVQKIVKFAEKVKCSRSQSRDFQLSLLAIVTITWYPSRCNLATHFAHQNAASRKPSRCYGIILYNCYGEYFI